MKTQRINANVVVKTEFSKVYTITGPLKKV